MKCAEFIEQTQAIVERVQQSAQGIADWMGEAMPEDAAKDIADLVPDLHSTTETVVGRSCAR